MPVMQSVDWARCVRLIATGALLTATGLGAASAAPAHLALVIGNAGYTGLPPLPGCTASANMAAAALKRAGFDVTEKLDPTNGEMGAAIAGLASGLAAAPGSSAVTYICGYAAGLGGRPFLLPTSANLQREGDVLTQGILAKSLIEIGPRSKAAASLVLIDAVPKPGGGPTGLDSLSREPASEGQGLAIAIATETAQGPSPLATALGPALAAPPIEIGAMLSGLSGHLSANKAVALSVRPPPAAAFLIGAPEMPTPAAPAGPAPALADDAHLDEAGRQRVQALLQHLGYYDGQVDGRFGPETRAAIRRFQHEIGSDMTGALSAADAEQLSKRGN